MLPWWLRWWRICLHCGKPKFNPWVGKIPWRREWQLTLVFLPGEFHGQGSLADYSPRGCKESDTTERVTLSLSHIPNVQSPTQMHTHWVKLCFKLYVICLSLLPQNMGTTPEALRECPTTSSASASMMNHPYNSKPRCSQLWDGWARAVQRAQGAVRPPLLYPVTPRSSHFLLFATPVCDSRSLLLITLLTHSWNHKHIHTHVHTHTHPATKLCILGNLYPW